MEAALGGDGSAHVDTGITSPVLLPNVSICGRTLTDLGPSGFKRIKQR